MIAHAEQGKPTRARSRPTPRFLAGLFVLAGLLLVVLANVHLVYVAFTSQPQCIRHQKLGAGPLQTGSFSAAASAC